VIPTRKRRAARGRRGGETTVTPQPSPAAAPDPELDAILGLLSRHRGFDVGADDRKTVTRRILGRMAAAGIASVDAYADVLEIDADEWDRLLDALVADESMFFRDAAVWDHLRDAIVPRAASRAEEGGLRVWSAGCASGEEAYAIAMLFADHLGIDAFARRVKVYATDIDPAALTRAREAVYPAGDLAALPRRLADAYLERSGDAFAVRREIQRNVVVGRHDIARDTPVVQVDVLLCRDVLAYHTRDAQAAMLSRLYSALNDGGVLVLGQRESIAPRTGLFEPLDLERRVFQRLPRDAARERPSRRPARGARPRDGALHGAHATAAAFAGAPVAQIVVDADGMIATANEKARALLELSADDVGRCLHDVELPYRPPLLRSRIDEVIDTGSATELAAVEWPTGVVVDIRVSPLVDADVVIGVQVAFTDVTRLQSVERELRASQDELASARQEVQATSEELVTTNEQLQTSIEELETANEELQSTNEELETMNEELQATNDQLMTTNAELQERSDDLNRMNAFLGSILRSLRAAVVVVNAEFEVLVWNRVAEDLWGLRADEAQGKHLLSLDVGFPVERLKPPIRACMAGAHEERLTLSAIDRRGRPVVCRIHCCPLINAMKMVGGAIVFMEANTETTGTAPPADEARAVKRRSRRASTRRARKG